MAISTALIELPSHPLLIFTVTGTLTELTTAFTISYTLSGFFKSALPAWAETATLGTGQPIFMSIISGFIFFSIYFAASTNEFLSLPKICWEIGLSKSVI